jgi:MoaA/NifB/PqqE/SkfB family radical SAM enzyme
MCGNLGDPIMAKDTLKIYQYIRSINSSMILQMNTNGSARSKEWWEELAKYNVKVIFGIDGLEDTHHLYRINTNWGQILKNAKIFIDAGGEAVWDMIVFKHNEHQINSCKELSLKLGFKHFAVKHTSRFTNNQLNVLDETGKTVHILYPSEKSLAITKKVHKAQEEHIPTIHCKSKRDSQIYVGSNGNVAPCCWISQHEWSVPYSLFRIDYMDKIGQYPNLNNQSLKQIFNSEYFDLIEKTWTTTGLSECSKQCGSCDKFMEQFNV